MERTMEDILTPELIALILSADMVLKCINIEQLKNGTIRVIPKKSKELNQMELQQIAQSMKFIVGLNAYINKEKRRGAKE
jgi:diadenosine tetraphosphate (Ap4A) HIT family hydrolase